MPPVPRSTEAKLRHSCHTAARPSCPQPLQIGCANWFRVMLCHVLSSFPVSPLNPIISLAPTTLTAMQPNTASFTARSSSTIDLRSSQRPALCVSIGQDTTAMQQIGWQWVLCIEKWNIVKHLAITMKHRAILLSAPSQFGNEALSGRNTILTVLHCLTPNICMYVYIYIYIYIYIYHGYTYIHIHIHIYIYTHRIQFPRFQHVARIIYGCVREWRQLTASLVPVPGAEVKGSMAS